MEDKELLEILIEAVYISRWNKDKTSLTAALTPQEAEDICSDIIYKLDEAGYKIIKK